MNPLASQQTKAPGSTSRIVWQIVLAAALVAIFVFAVRNTANLTANERSLHANAAREPQSADPLQSFVEVFIPPAPMPLLSGGYAGIAPSIHLTRLGSTRPLSNIDPIEHPARRRFGRTDISFALIFVLPVALLLLSILVSRQISASGALEKLRTRKTTLFDFAVENLLLPVSGWLALCFAAIVSAMYAYGLRVDSNESLLRILFWTLAAAFYAGLWLLLFAWLSARLGSLVRAVLAYALCFVGLAVVIPALFQTITLAVVRPESRITTVLERRALSRANGGFNAELSSALLASAGVRNSLAEASLKYKQAVTMLAVERSLGPQLDRFDQKVRTLESLGFIGSWLSPSTITQAAVDGLAGTGVERYATFRDQSLAFQNAWQAAMMPRFLRQQFLDYDALKAAPRFRFADLEFGTVLVQAGVRIAVLAGLCGILLFLLLREAKKVVAQ